MEMKELELDLREVNDEVAENFARYERALISRDLEVLREMFWESPLTLRFGVADHQFGADELEKWRKEASPLPPGRTLTNTQVTSFNKDFAVVTTLFTYPNRNFLGRQSQTWVRFDQGWKIVSAHVSEVPKEHREPQY